MKKMQKRGHFIFKSLKPHSTKQKEMTRSFEDIDKAARHKVEAQKRAIPEGSAEWEILYRKYYEEEMRTVIE